MRLCFQSGVLLAAFFAVLAPESRAQDLASFLELGKFYVKPVSPTKDARTGFVVGGKNATALIRGLTELNGRTIAELEADMRPGAKSEAGSTGGFLGREEKLLEVLAADNDYVVGELGSTHQELAKHLHAMGSIAYWQSVSGAEFVYCGWRFQVSLRVSAGSQPSPFLDGTKSGSEVTVTNVSSGKKLSYSLLVPYMVERYGFYEGTGTPYRVDPRKVVEVFDFLEKKSKK